MRAVDIERRRATRGALNKLAVVFALGAAIIVLDDGLESFGETIFFAFVLSSVAALKIAADGIIAPRYSDEELEDDCFNSCADAEICEAVKSFARCDDCSTRCPMTEGAQCQNCGCYEDCCDCGDWSE